MADAVPLQNAGAGEGQVVPPVAPQINEAPKPENVATVPSEVPLASEVPVASQVPVASEVPEASEVPVASETPVANETPVASQAPVTNDATTVASEVPVKPSETPVQTEVKAEIDPTLKVQGDWSQREQELLKKIDELEKAKTLVGEDKLKVELKLKEQEVELLKARVVSLETELQLALSKPGGTKNQEVIENIKQQHEELLSKARGMIFDKTKMVKNQELQIEALNMQVQSLKDINIITKDLLEIRNSEVKAMEDRLVAMEARFKAEKERFGLVLQKAEASGNLNGDLKKEYVTQLALFKELRVKYEERVQALVAENNKLKESLKVDPPTTT